MTPIKEKMGSTAEFARDSSLEQISNSFYYPTTKSKLAKFSAQHSVNSVSELNGESFSQKRKRVNTKSFVGKYNDESIQDYEVTKKKKPSMHVRHKSDGYKIPVTVSNHYAKYIKNTNLAKKPKQKKLTTLNHEGSNHSTLITSSKLPTYFRKKKMSCTSDISRILTKRSPSIKFLKK